MPDVDLRYLQVALTSPIRDQGLTELDFEVVQVLNRRL